MAEGNYPFASTYIPFSMGIDIPFPPWPTRVGCAAGLDKDLGIKIAGNVSDVKYKLSMGAFELEVDWANVTGNGKDLTKQQIDESGIFDLVRGYVDFNAVLANITGKFSCYGEESDELTSKLAEAHDQRFGIADASRNAAAVERVDNNAEGASLVTSAEDCPPCEGCPPCPVSTRKAPPKVCNGTAKPDSWGLVTCNDIMHLAATQVRGVGGVRRGSDRRWFERGQRPLRAHLGLLREAIPRDLFQCRHHGRLLQQRFSAGLEDRNLMECLCKVQLDLPLDAFEIRLLTSRVVRVEEQRVDQEGDEPVRAQEQLLVDVLWPQAPLLSSGRRRALSCQEATY